MNEIEKQQQVRIEELERELIIKDASIDGLQRTLSEKQQHTGNVNVEVSGNMREVAGRLRSIADGYGHPDWTLHEFLLAIRDAADTVEEIAAVRESSSIEPSKPPDGEAELDQVKRERDEIENAAIGYISDRFAQEARAEQSEALVEQLRGALGELVEVNRLTERMVTLYKTTNMDERTVLTPQEYAQFAELEQIRAELAKRKPAAWEAARALRAAPTIAPSGEQRE